MWCTGRFCFSNNCVCIIQTEFQRLADITADLTDPITFPYIVYRPLEFIMAEKTEGG